MDMGYIVSSGEFGKWAQCYPDAYNALVRISNRQELRVLRNEAAMYDGHPPVLDAAKKRLEWVKSRIVFLEQIEAMNEDIKTKYDATATNP